MSDHLKTQQAVVWSRRFSMLYAFGVWTVIGFFVARSMSFQETPPKKEEEEEEKKKKKKKDG